MDEGGQSSSPKLRNQPWGGVSPLPVVGVELGRNLDLELFCSEGSERKVRAEPACGWLLVASCFDCAGRRAWEKILPAASDVLWCGWGQQEPFCGPPSGVGSLWQFPSDPSPSCVPWLSASFSFWSCVFVFDYFQILVCVKFDLGNHFLPHAVGLRPCNPS